MLRRTANCQFCSKPISLSNIRKHSESCERDSQKDRTKLFGWKSISKDDRVAYSQRGAAVKLKNLLERREVRLNTLPFDQLNISEKRDRIRREQNHLCAECNLGSIWNNKPITFELDHINGNRRDDSRNNLRFLCPNCHSQTPTFRGKNANGKYYTDTQIASVLKTSKSIHDALITLGMTPQGAVYERLRRIATPIQNELAFEI